MYFGFVRNADMNGGRRRITGASEEEDVFLVKPGQGKGPRLPDDSLKRSVLRKQKQKVRFTPGSGH